MTPPPDRSSSRLTPAQRRELALVVAAGPSGLSGGTGAELKMRRHLARMGLVGIRLDAVGGADSGISLQRFTATEAGRSAVGGIEETSP